MTKPESYPPIKILVAEDDPLILETLIDLLEMSGFEVVPTTNGREALQAFSRAMPDVVLTDIRMPECDGFELMRSIHDQVPWMPVILLSAKAAESDIRTGMELGADDYLVKPFDIEKVIKSIRTRVARSVLVAKRMDRRGAFLRRYLPHELRTPLTGIMGFGEILQNELNESEKPDLEALKDYADGIVKSADRLLELIENFTLWADLSTGTEALDRHLFADPDSHALIELREQLLQLAKRYGREDDLSVRLESVMLPLQQKFLLRVVFNLMDNACKFSMPGSPIKVDGRRGISDYVISFENQQGNGMGPPKVPDFFEQPARPQVEQQGLGMGLALACLYAKAVNGRLESIADSTTHRVKTSLWLPLEDSQASVPSTAADEPPPALMGD